MKNKKNLATIVLAVLCVSALVVGSLALFTDRFQADVNLTASTLDLVLEQSWNEDNATVMTKGKFKPGTGLVLDYTLSNGGNGAARVKETIAISCDQKMTNADGKIPEFALYNYDDVTVASDGTVTIKAGKTPIATQDNFVKVTGVTDFKVGETDWSQMLYEFDEIVLSGSIEKVAGKESQDKNSVYVVVFNINSSNDFQNTTLNVEYLAQGLQYGNTGEKTWADGKVVSQTVTIGGDSAYEAVPQLTFSID